MAFPFLAVGLVVAVVGIGVTALLEGRSTGEKVKNGDSVFVNATSLRPLSGSPVDIDALRVFLSGFLATNVKVTSVAIGPNKTAVGNIIGLSPSVLFDLSAVTRIERDGKQFT
jgi:hypothetical protein